jgi:hypothetical protein
MKICNYNDLKMGVEPATTMSYVQQNSFNPVSSNVGILIIWQLSKVVPRRKVLLFTRKHVVSGLTPCLLLQLLQLWRLQKTDKDPSDPKPADKGDIQMEYSSD